MDRGDTQNASRRTATRHDRDLIICVKTALSLAIATRLRAGQEIHGVFSKLWDVHIEAAFQVTRAVFKAGARPCQVPLLTTKYFHGMALRVRKFMMENGASCATAKLIATTELTELGRGIKYPVTALAFHAALSLFSEVQDCWIESEAVVAAGGFIGGRYLWNKHVQSSSTMQATHRLVNHCVLRMCLPQNAQQAAQEEYITRSQRCDIPRLFLMYFGEFLASSRRRCSLQGLTFEAARKSTVAAIFTEQLPDDPANAAACASAALLLLAIPEGVSPEDHIPPLFSGPGAGLPVDSLSRATDGGPAGSNSTAGAGSSIFGSISFGGAGTPP